VSELRPATEYHGEVHRDADGSLIEVGTRIAAASGTISDKNGMRTYDIPGGVIKEISDPDGDVDDEGRTIGINPQVTVLYDDGEEDTYTTFYDWQSGEWTCEDITVEQ
jgi:hypothetical protein